MRVQHQSKIEIVFDLSHADIGAGCEQLRKQGSQAAAAAMDILRGLGDIVANLTETAGALRLVVVAASDGKIQSSLTVDTPNRSEAAPPVSVANPEALDIGLAGFGTHAKNVLYAMNATTLGDVAKLSRSELRCQPGCGKKTIHEIEQTLRSHDLTLRA